MDATRPAARLPDQIVHADWSKDRRKRWMARALLQPDGTYLARAPETVGPTDVFLPGLRAEAGADACLLVGFDFPIGLPVAYASRAGISRFLEVLPDFGAGQWQDFYCAAEMPEQINLRRPFYPARPGGSRRDYLVGGLGVADFNALRRRCELAQAGRRAAAPLFWTMGPQQVGKAAQNGWQEVLVPGLQNPDLHMQIWPFSGCLEELLIPGSTVVAETYPAEYYAQALGEGSLEDSRRRFSKRNQQDRRRRAASLIRWTQSLGLALERDLLDSIHAGFSGGAPGEDQFDATIGLLGMLSVLLGQRSVGEPLDQDIRQIEGWILGQQLP